MEAGRRGEEQRGEAKKKQDYEKVRRGRGEAGGKGGETEVVKRGEKEKGREEDEKRGENTKKQDRKDKEVRDGVWEGETEVVKGGEEGTR